jgi:hypothetical protein
VVHCAVAQLGAVGFSVGNWDGRDSLLQ